jgi:hypothetical protein
LHPPLQILDDSVAKPLPSKYLVIMIALLQIFGPSDGNDSACGSYKEKYIAFFEERSKRNVKRHHHIREEARAEGREK